MEGMRNNRVNKNQSNKRKRLEGNNLKMKTYVEENNKNELEATYTNMLLWLSYSPSRQEGKSTRCPVLHSPFDEFIGGLESSTLSWFNRSIGVSSWMGGPCRPQKIISSYSSSTCFNVFHDAKAPWTMAYVSFSSYLYAMSTCTDHSCCQLTKWLHQGL